MTDRLEEIEQRVKAGGPVRGSNGRWRASAQRDAAIVAAYVAREPVKAIAARFGISKRAVFDCLDRNGQPRRGHTIKPWHDPAFVADRFWGQVMPEPNSGCWLWTGTVTEDGYGQMWAGTNRPVWAHRYSYALHKGEIPAGLQLDHLCCVTSCVNPDHLEPVTVNENVRRMHERRAQLEKLPHD